MFTVILASAMLGFALDLRIFCVNQAVNIAINAVPTGCSFRKGHTKDENHVDICSINAFISEYYKIVNLSSITGIKDVRYIFCDYFSALSFDYAQDGVCGGLSPLEICGDRRRISLK